MTFERRLHASVHIMIMLEYLHNYTTRSFKHVRIQAISKAPLHQQTRNRDGRCFRTQILVSSFTMCLLGRHQTLLLTDKNSHQHFDINELIIERENFSTHVKFRFSFENKPSNCCLRFSLRDFSNGELMPISLSEGKFCD